MKMLVNQKTFESLRSRDKVPLKCSVCSETFYATKNQVQVVLKGVGSHTLAFCGKQCANKAAEKRYKTTVIKCDFCGKEVKRPPSAIAKHPLQFCSLACSMRYNNKHKRTGKTNKSAGEGYLASLISADFPGLVIERNDRSILPSGLEVDLLIRSLNLAIELNGPFHYFPIFGDAKLADTQNADIRKQNEIHEIGFRLITINASSVRDGKRMRKFFSDYYSSHLKPLLLFLGALQ